MVFAGAAPQPDAAADDQLHLLRRQLKRLRVQHGVLSEELEGCRKRERAHLLTQRQLELATARIAALQRAATSADAHDARHGACLAAEVARADALQEQLDGCGPLSLVCMQRGVFTGVQAGLCCRCLSAAVACAGCLRSTAACSSGARRWPSGMRAWTLVESTGARQTLARRGARVCFGPRSPGPCSHVATAWLGVTWGLLGNLALQATDAVIDRQRRDNLALRACTLLSHHHPDCEVCASGPMPRLPLCRRSDSIEA